MHCSQCSWKLDDDLAGEDWELLGLLHVLVRHPEIYYEVTGVAPKTAVEAYGESLNDDLVMVLI